MISVINYFSALIWLYGGIILNESHRSDRSCPMRARSTNNELISEKNICKIGIEPELNSLSC